MADPYFTTDELRAMDEDLQDTDRFPDPTLEQDLEKLGGELADPFSE